LYLLDPEQQFGLADRMTAWQCRSG